MEESGIIWEELLDLKVVQQQHVLFLDDSVRDFAFHKN